MAELLKVWIGEGFAAIRVVKQVSAGRRGDRKGLVEWAV
jgi:hypothetical protein